MTAITMPMGGVLACRCGGNDEICYCIVVDDSTCGVLGAFLEECF